MTLDLWIDADDTLWENNVFFERAFAAFAGYLNHPSLTAAEVRVRLDDIERVNNRIHGYGSANFARNLTQCFEQLAPRPVTSADRQWISRLGADLANHPMELIDGVEETLVYLSARHQLMLCTKGDPGEQQAKIGRSGLAGHFHHVRIVREKDRACYEQLLAERSVDAGRCWMVGNSPKSDINPALAAGIGAVYVPHPHTWHLEHQDVPEEHGRLLVVETFSGLRRYF
ncbi:MAG: hydrolase [Acidobacteria bacterium]|nr:hydrolase [Acidobacteriota bacterium]